MNENERLLSLLHPMIDAGVDWMKEAKRLRTRNAKLERVAWAAERHLATGQELELAQALAALGELTATGEEFSGE